MSTTNLKCEKCGYEAKDENDRKQHMEQKHADQADAMGKKSGEEKSGM